MVIAGSRSASALMTVRMAEALQPAPTATSIPASRARTAQRRALSASIEDRRGCTSGQYGRFHVGARCAFTGTGSEARPASLEAAVPAVEGARCSGQGPESPTQSRGLNMDALRRALDMQQRRLAAIAWEKPCDGSQEASIAQLRDSLRVLWDRQGRCETDEQRLSEALGELRVECSSVQEALAAADFQRQDESTVERRKSASMLSHEDVFRQMQALAPPAAADAQGGGLHLELAEIRAEQREVLERQACAFRKEFEAAFRAEELADAALVRVAGLERSLASLRRSPEEGKWLSQRLDDMHSLVARLDNRLAHLEHHLESTLAVQSERLAESLTHSSRALGTLAEESDAARAPCQARLCEEVDACIRGSVLCELDEWASRCNESCAMRSRAAAADVLSTAATEVNAAEAVAAAAAKGAEARERAFEQHVAALLLEERCSREDSEAKFDAKVAALQLERNCEKAKSSGDGGLSAKLHSLHAGFAEDLSELGRSVAEAHAGLAAEMRGERQARTQQVQDLRDELTDAMLVVKTQFEHWMSAVDAVRSELDELTRAVKLSGRHGAAPSSLTPRAAVAAAVAAARTSVRELDDSPAAVATASERG